MIKWLLSPKNHCTKGQPYERVHFGPQFPSACYRKGKRRKRVQTTSILQRVCDTMESPMIYRSEGEGRRYMAQTFVHEFDLTVDQVKLNPSGALPHARFPSQMGSTCTTPSFWDSPLPPCLLAPCNGKSPACPLQTPSTRTTPPTTSPPFYAGAGSTGGPAQPLHLSSPHPPASLSSNAS